MQPLMHWAFQVGIKLANLLLLCWRWTVTNKQAAEITQLYRNLDEYDRKALEFTPRWKKAKGRFLKKKASGHIGTEAMARYKLNNNIGGKGKKKT